MPVFDDLDKAIKFIEQGISQGMGTMEKELKEEAIIQGQRLYDSYNPRSGYQRRYTLLDSSKFHVTKRKMGNMWELEGESFVTGRTNNRLDEILSKGNAPHWNGRVPGRPYLKWTEDEFKVIAEEIMRESLKKQGIL